MASMVVKTTINNESGGKMSKLETTTITTNKRLRSHELRSLSFCATKNCY